MEGVGEFEYNTKDLIGHGAFAVVFKGRQKKNHGFVVAIKSISKKNLSKSQNLLGKEIKILKELTELHHENVVALLDCKETPHHVYLVMEYCNGGDLADYLHAKGTLSEDTIRAFLRQLAGAMKALNAKGIVHRDLKPQNILLCHSGKSNPAPHEIRLKIADFGFARFLQDGVMAATLCGSPMYMAPEVIMSIQYDAKADLWSIGTIVFQCLTGKAPFQAQTPQALKQFYEKNVNLAPKIPSGTSSDLSDLLVHLLKRNAKERLEFDDFFSHPFLKKIAKPSSPVPVPMRQHSLPRDFPHMKPLMSSPLPGITPLMPSNVGEVINAVPVEDLVAVPLSTLPFEPGGGYSPNSKMHGSPSSPEEHEDFVLVSANIRSDNSYDSVGALSGKRKSGDIQGTSPMTVGTPPSKMNVIGTGSPGSGGRSPYDCRNPSPSSPGSSSPRPSYLPVTNSPNASSKTTTTVITSEPIPVPSQKEAYQQIQQSLRESPGSPCPHLVNTGGGRERHHSASSPLSSPRVFDGNRPSSVPRSQPIIMRKDSIENIGRMTDITSLSPPTVQFVIGTPPSGNRRQSMSTPPPSPWPCIPSGRQTPTGSPLKRSGMNSPPLNTNYFFGNNPLPPIMSSTNQPSSLINYNTLFPNLSPQTDGFGGGGCGGHGVMSPSQPLVMPFGVRARTLPDISSKEMSFGGSGMDTTSHDALMPRSGSAGKLGEPFGGILGAAFVNPQGVSGPDQTSPPSSVMMPYGRPCGTSPAYRVSFTTAGMLCDSSSTGIGGLSGNNGVGGGSPGLHWHFGNLPSNMEGPVFFVAPELPEETLMEREHNETLAKLNFVLALVDCIVDLARARSTPIATLTESMIRRENNSVEQIAIVSESYRRAEQLVLYVRALHMLSSSLNLSKDELKSGRLQPSNSVKNVVSVMNDKYHHCLLMCKNLNSQNLLVAARNDPRTSNITADKLLYNYAIEMCQSAALDELFGNPQECFRRYQTAQLLLHSLAQQMNNEYDRGLLSRYKEAVEKRLFVLQQQGYIYSYDTTCDTT